MFELLKMKKLKNNIVINEGGTLVPQTLKNLNRDNGYMVALAGYEKIIDLKKFNYRTLKAYKKIALEKDGYIGFWVDKKTNLLYLDISIYTSYKFKALEIARKNKQLAIFDLKNKESIYL